MLHDVFICHASEDKDTFVRPLAEALRDHHVEVWYDEFTLEIGDSLREAIDRGLSSSRLGIVVLSPSFFQKRWPKRELNGLVAREAAENQHLILPVWHQVKRNDVLHFSPPLADLVAVSSSEGIQSAVKKLLKKIRPDESPLIIARDFLIDHGLTPPVITDEWWLDLVEIKESDFMYPDRNVKRRWIFPLPYKSGARGKERGLNIAWTSMQHDWSHDGKMKKICQLSHPTIVHSFLRKWPGLLECAKNNPAILALYAPQITIPGFDDGFAEIWDSFLFSENNNICDAFQYLRPFQYLCPETTDGKKPLCADFIVWRHAQFGNYSAAELSSAFATAHDNSYSRSIYSGFECLIWLLSNDSEWLPVNLHETLKSGFRDRVNWWITGIWLSEPSEGSIICTLMEQDSRKFSYTKAICETLLANCERALHNIGVCDDSQRIVTEFIDYKFLDGFYDEEGRSLGNKKKLWRFF